MAIKEYLENAKTFFRGYAEETEIIPNPCTDSGEPKLKETRHYNPKTGEVFRTSFSELELTTKGTF